MFTDLVSTKSPSVSFTAGTNDISVLIGCDKILSSSKFIPIIIRKNK